VRVVEVLVETPVHGEGVGTVRTAEGLGRVLLGGVFGEGGAAAAHVRAPLLAAHQQRALRRVRRQRVLRQQQLALEHAQADVAREPPTTPERRELAACRRSRRRPRRRRFRATRVRRTQNLRRKKGIRKISNK
jgi:hypothetical protein